MEAAAAFLAVRPRSVDETRRRLRHHGYQPGLVDGVLERLVEMGYLDDEGFAQAWVESRDRARPRGEMALRRELSMKGIDRETIRKVLAGRADVARTATRDEGLTVSPERGAAARLLDRRRAALLGVTDPRQRGQKAYALLARNGFAPDICQEASAAFDIGPADAE
jgi:regulatory protein